MISAPSTVPARLKRPPSSEVPPKDVALKDPKDFVLIGKPLKRLDTPDKVNGKTVTRRITETEAGRYQEWIDNDRQLRDVIDQMRQTAAKIAELTLKQPASTQPEPASPQPHTHATMPQLTIGPQTLE